MQEEDTEDDDTTHEMKPPRLLPPVRSPDELPVQDVEEGSLCLVGDADDRSDRLWAFHDGRWAPAI